MHHTRLHCNKSLFKNFKWKGLSGNIIWVLLQKENEERKLNRIIGYENVSQKLHKYHLKQRPSHKPDSVKLAILPFNSFSSFKNFILIHRNQYVVRRIHIFQLNA